MRFGMIVALLLSAGLLARADEKIPVLKAGSETFSNVVVTSVSATDVYFISSGGMGNVKLKDLTPEMQKHFNFDPVIAKAVEQKQADDRLKYHEELLHQPAMKAPEMSRDSAPAADAAQETHQSAGKKIWAKSFLNQPAPDFVVEKWLTPEPDRRGKFVIIDFWATWCPPCREAISELNGYHEKFGDKLVVIGISDETEEAVRKLTNPNIEYSVAIDTQARMKKEVEVSGIPHVLIIDPQGIVRWEGFPFLEGYELNENIVAGILAKYSD